MQFPVYIWVGPLAIHPHPVFECLAYLAGAWALRNRTQAAPRAPWSDAMDRFDRLNRRAARAEEAAWRQSRY